MELTSLCVVLALSWISICTADDPNRLPTKCETCKYLTNEIAESLTKHSSHEYIETGYNIDERLNRKKQKKYMDSEVRLIEVMENVCESILDYHVHAERSGSLRYAKGESQTMSTLKGLKNRGVKVELGIPYDLWDTPSAEITQLKKYCDNMIGTYEDMIEEWYKNERDKVTLTEYLCERHLLKDEDKSCLTEVFVPSKSDQEPEEEKPKPKEEEKKKRKKKKKKRVEIEEESSEPDSDKDEL